MFSLTLRGSSQMGLYNLASFLLDMPSVLNTQERYLVEILNPSFILSSLALVSKVSSDSEIIIYSVSYLITVKYLRLHL